MPHTVKHEVRWCRFCGKDIPEQLRPHALFCSRSHAAQASATRRLAPVFFKVPLPRTRKPPVIGPRRRENVNRDLIALVARLESQR